MSEAEEELLAWGLNSLHDAGAVHHSDLQMVCVVTICFYLMCFSSLLMLTRGSQRNGRILLQKSKRGNPATFGKFTYLIVLSNSITTHDSEPVRCLINDIQRNGPQGVCPGNAKTYLHAFHKDKLCVQENQ